MKDSGSCSQMMPSCESPIVLESNLTQRIRNKINIMWKYLQSLWPKHLVFLSSLEHCHLEMRVDSSEGTVGILLMLCGLCMDHL